MKFTRELCDRMREAGLLEPGKYELIEGELITFMGMNRPHGFAVQALNVELSRTFGTDRMMIQMPIDLSPEDRATSEPQPDLAVLRRSFRELPMTTPGTADLLLVVEVSDTTLVFDRYTKGRLYARARIPEYWVLDLNARKLIVHREPSGDAYSSVAAYAADESVSPLGASPDAQISVAVLLP
jgi:Uma2 family endonuclease